MPINAGYEYGEAQKKLAEAKTPEEKIKALENLLSVSPSHKGAEKLRQELKTKISKLKSKQEKEKSAKRGGRSIAIKKEGAAQVTLVGLTNSGKSTIIQKFTNAKPQIAEYEFTTKTAEVAIMDYHGVKIQLVELPAIFTGYSYSSMGPTYLSIARNSDLVVIIIDGLIDCEEQLKSIETEFLGVGVRLRKINDTSKESIKCLVVLNKMLKPFKCKYPVIWVDDFKDGIWRMLDLVYVYTKQPGKDKDYPPVALKKGSDVETLASVVHKDFIKNFRFARVWGKSAKHAGANVSLNHKLAENDIVEFHIK